ncbi:MAG: uracil-DNA glycosylase [Sphingomonadales bacterium]|nr:uracil-DNA glycosylase [Sphingomonadales bacterium]
MGQPGSEPPRNCPDCPRLVEFRNSNRNAHPCWHNAPVLSFGRADARLLIVGLAPGLKGANRTGRPFTGDFAGDLLYSTLLTYGFAQGSYGADPADGLELIDCRITNAVRCVPPQNKPTPFEINTCRPFLAATMTSMARLAVILALGRTAHESTLVSLGHKRSGAPFAHAARSELMPGVTLFSSYHCSRYNTQTGRLTTEMFHAVVAAIRAHLDGKAN